MSRKEQFVGKLRALIELLESLDESEFAAVFNGTQGNVRASKRVVSTTPPLSSEEQSRLTHQLQAASSREEVQNLIESDARLKSKPSIVRLARSLKVHVLKSDSREQLAEKIAEATVGYRLRSEAIRSVNFRAGNG